MIGHSKWYSIHGAGPLFHAVHYIKRSTNDIEKKIYAFKSSINKHANSEKHAPFNLLMQ